MTTDLIDENVYPSVFYILRIYFDENVLDKELIGKYKQKIHLIQEKIKIISMENTLDGLKNLDAGFDLFIPKDQIITSNAISIPLDQGIKCAMYFNKIPSAFYLYPRSSMGSKTPLRLSNSVGIIDAGYRGNLCGIIDNISYSNNYILNKGDRLLQICAPNISHPIYPIYVNSIDELGTTERGEDGFGSTGR